MEGELDELIDPLITWGKEQELLENEAAVFESSNETRNGERTAQTRDGAARDAV